MNDKNNDRDYLCFISEKENEIWRNIEDYPNYKISSMGRVLSFGNGKKNRLLGRSANVKYPQVLLYKNKESKLHYIHRLVATAFILNSERKRCVNHIDRNPCNNCVSNLEWVTYKENTQHSMQLIGEWFYKPTHKEIVQFDLNENYIREFKGMNELINILFTNNPEFERSIYSALKGVQKTAHGFIWKYKKDIKNG